MVDGSVNVGGVDTAKVAWGVRMVSGWLREPIVSVRVDRKWKVG